MLPRVKSTSKPIWLVGPVVSVMAWLSCGGASVDGSVGPTGGSVCLPDRRVCIDVPIAALETQEVLRISPGGEAPSAALSDGYDIKAVSGKPITFDVPATVHISLDAVRTDGIDNLNILRLYTKLDGGDWQPLSKTFVDRVKNEVIGETSHLSPFVVLRSDRLPDGGLPNELDASVPFDAGIIVIPPRPDSGVPDAGRPDAGTPDAGVPDAGQPDSGVPDAGVVDSGVPDAGVPDDSGVPDAGQPDAGVTDAGVDAGDPDAGLDAGTDAG
jgi:hypothetical protein